MAHQLFEVVASCQGDDALIERLMDRVIKPEFDSFGWSQGRMEWTWDLESEEAAAAVCSCLERTIALHKLEGLITMETRSHNIVDEDQAVQETIAA